MGAYGPDVVIFLDTHSRLFDEVSVSDSDISVLSDPFSEDDVAEVKKKHPDLTGQDVCAAFEFSSTFRDLVQKHGGDTNRGVQSMMGETLDHIRAKTVFTQIRKKVPLVAQMKVVSILGDGSIQFVPKKDGDAVGDNKMSFVPDDHKTWEDIKDEIIGSRMMMKNIKKLTERERSRKILVAQQENEAYETMSGYWHLLSDYRTFRISPPGFDAYAGPEKHWLETEHIPWSTMENARAKVMYWLNKYC